MKRSILLMLVSLFLVVGTAFSATLKTTWEPYSDTADGFRIYHITSEQSAVVVWEEEDSSLTSAQFEYDEAQGCGTFYLVAYLDQAESEPSNTALWCPKNVIPPMQARPGQIIQFTIEVVQ